VVDEELAVPAVVEGIRVDRGAEEYPGILGKRSQSDRLSAAGRRLAECRQQRGEHDQDDGGQSCRSREDGSGKRHGNNTTVVRLR
jgi:hypothetical protein